MNTSLVLTVIGEDRPGLVDHLSHCLAQHGANWLQSRMANLGGRFAGIVEASVPSARCEDLLAALAALEKQGLRVMVDVRSEPEQAVPASQTCRLDLVGQDRVGIVQELSHALASRGVNIHELSTESESASWSGEQLFRAHALLDVPADLALTELQAGLEKLANELMVDIQLEKDA